MHIPDCVGLTVCSWGKSGYGIEDCSGRNVFARGDDEYGDTALGVP